MSRFNPYTDNGGSILAIAGADFSVIAGDTRHTAGYSINTRHAIRSFHVGDNVVVAVVGRCYTGNGFFPYYVTTIVAGLDERGVGAVYSFDPVGSYEREQCRAAGAASSLIMPFLDNQVNLKNQYDDAGEQLVPRPLELGKVLSLCRDAFTSATERHIEAGDSLEFAIITAQGVKWENVPLKLD
ncbi:hypothetical protein MRB53_039210 [Persea americana]|nr:hypothetical protein MRB53_039210 [Persea americana]